MPSRPRNPKTPPAIDPPCNAADFDWLVYGNGPLHGHWQGWRIAGRCLVAPDGGRIPAERVRGLIFRQEAEERLARARARNEAARNTKAQQPVRVVVVTLAEFQAMRTGAA